jgi:uncharacterized protein DUF6788
MQETKERPALLSPASMEKLREQYVRLAYELSALPWVCQGSVMHTPPNAFRWTRKVNKKTVTVALSKEQASLITEAITHHRKLETILKEMRLLSEKALLGSTPGVQKKAR